jgi:hypothetical protein
VSFPKGRNEARWWVRWKKGKNWTEEKELKAKATTTRHEVFNFNDRIGERQKDFRGNHRSSMQKLI